MSGFIGFLLMIGGMALIGWTKFQPSDDPSGKHTIVMTSIIGFGLMATGMGLVLASDSDAVGVFVLCFLPVLLIMTNELLLGIMVSEIGAADRRKHKSKRKNDWIATKSKRDIR